MEIQKQRLIGLRILTTKKLLLHTIKDFSLSIKESTWNKVLNLAKQHMTSQKLNENNKTL